MSDEDDFDRLLRRTLAADEPPALSEDFDRALARRLRPRTLAPRGRRLVAAYAVLASVCCLWTMRRTGLSWPMIAAAMVSATVVVAALCVWLGLFVRRGHGPGRIRTFG